MRQLTGRWIRVLVLAALVVALAIPASAGAEPRRPRAAHAETGSIKTLTAVANDLDGNGDISTADDLLGVPSSPPVVGTLNRSTDVDDVYWVDLQAGQTFSARVFNPTAGTDYDLYLFGPIATPSATSVDTATPVARAEAAYSSPDMLSDPLTEKQFVAPADGRYYLDVYMVDAPSSSAYQYTLQYALGDFAPKVALRASTSTVAYDGTVTLSGVVKDSTDASMTGAPVELWAVSYPYETYTRRLTTTTDPSTGSYSFATKVNRWTLFKVVCPTSQPNYGWGESSPPVSVKSRVSLGAPRVYSGRRYHNRAFTVYGYLKPRHASGQKHVKITAYRSDAGVWKVATNYYKDSTFTKYSTSIILPYAGKWKLVASTPDDGYHAATTSAATYVTVR